MLKNGPKILYLDIETSLMEVYTFGIGDQYLGLSDIKPGTERRILSFAAKWDGKKEMIQFDLRKGINNKNEKDLLSKLFKLMDEADVIIGQNSDSFDVKIVNDGFLLYDLGIPSLYRTRDTYKISKRYFNPISHKLEYRSETLNKKYKKQKHSKFPGKKLWIECQNGNKDAWEEMATYNIFDVLATEEYYIKLRPWDANGININVFSDDLLNTCSCGNPHIQKRGFGYTNTGKFQKYQCTSCGKWTQSKQNLLSKEKRAALRK